MTPEQLEAWRVVLAALPSEVKDFFILTTIAWEMSVAQITSSLEQQE